jgi:hypothetical protein
MLETYSGYPRQNAITKRGPRFSYKTPLSLNGAIVINREQLADCRSGWRGGCSNEENDLHVNLEVLRIGRPEERVAPADTTLHGL